MNPIAGGGQNNLYRCFVDLSFRLAAPQGCIALIHQDGHLTDPKSGAFRKEWYRRVVKHFDFLNVIKTKTFSEIAHYARFSLNVYRGTSGEISFQNVTYVYLPAQIEDLLRHDGSGAIPQFKTSEGKWDTRGHADRIVTVDRSGLEAINALTENTKTPVEQTRFLQPYSTKMLNVFRALSSVPSLESSIEHVQVARITGDGTVIETIPGWQVSHVWHETNAQKVLGAIRRETKFRTKLNDMIISGPTFHVGNPFYKTPKSKCNTKADYFVIDLTDASNDYLPRTNYIPNIPRLQYLNLIPRCRWEPGRTHLDSYRFAFRKMINLNSERSFIGALISPEIAHIHGIYSVLFKDLRDLIQCHALSISLPYDFLIKVHGRQNLESSGFGALPFIDPGDTPKHRGLRLACLTTAYAALWNEHARDLSPLPWHSADPRLTLEGPVQGPVTWDRTAALRTEFARRMALVEIDVLVAQALGLTLDQLIDIYRIYFPVLQQNEAGTWYDRNGRIAWTCSKGLPGVGYLEDGKSPSRRRWEQILDSGQHHLECEAEVDFMPGGPHRVTRTFEGPFDTCDRVEDYKRAWAYFEAAKTCGKAAA